ncbi:hypothetical protein [Nonomuraea rubra]|uniref:Uncharacterized protein n=1 Tax=Nonomuraea rubra TaxID=46180 RepID=A0A7X0P6J5_9ACTN|nr:hypothetical protein [Nonomuraea rubra]MBB6556205.1 hypothetical protein [Nonomuraea rubra]
MVTFTDTEAVIASYITANATPGRWTSLTEIRQHLTRWTRPQVDTTLRLMERLEDVCIAPESNQKTLTEQDRAAAVEIGGQAKHLIWIAG